MVTPVQLQLLYNEYIRQMLRSISIWTIYIIYYIINNNIIFIYNDNIYIYLYKVKITYNFVEDILLYYMYFYVDAIQYNTVI